MEDYKAKGFSLLPRTEWRNLSVTADPYDWELYKVANWGGGERISAVNKAFCAHSSKIKGCQEDFCAAAGRVRHQSAGGAEKRLRD